MQTCRITFQNILVKEILVKTLSFMLSAFHLEPSVWQNGAEFIFPNEDWRLILQTTSLHQMLL